MKRSSTPLEMILHLGFEDRVFINEFSYS